VKQRVVYPEGFLTGITRLGSLLRFLTERRRCRVFAECERILPRGMNCCPVHAAYILRRRRRLRMTPDEIQEFAERHFGGNGISLAISHGGGVVRADALADANSVFDETVSGV
jgi:hypothetical protein